VVREENYLTDVQYLGRMSESEKPKKGLTSEMIIAVSAVFISLVTLAVSIYQAQIMSQDLRSSAWPYIQWDLTQRSDEGFILSVHNKGIGPALLKSTELSYDGETVKDARRLIAKFVSIDSIGLFYSNIDNTVMAPGDRVEFFHIYVDNTEEYQRLLQTLRPLFQKISFRICYCDIYGDCWTTTGTKVTEVECSDQKP